MKIILGLILAFNVFAKDYTGNEAKEIFNLLNSSLDLNCSDKNCDFKLTYLSCSSIKAFDSVKCTALRNIADGVEIKSITNSSATKLLNLMETLSDSVQCQDILGVKNCSVSEVNCSKTTKLFIEKYSCLLE